MADTRTAVTVQTFAENVAAAISGVAFTNNTESEAEVFKFIPPKEGKYLLYVKNSNSTASKPITVNVESGDFWMAGKGDYSFSVASEGEEKFVILESARFKGGDGYIEVTITPTTGEVLKNKGLIKVLKLA